MGSGMSCCCCICCVDYEHLELYERANDEHKHSKKTVKLPPSRESLEKAPLLTKNDHVG